jgi:hypothetical protein
MPSAYALGIGGRSHTSSSMSFLRVQNEFSDAFDEVFFHLCGHGLGGDRKNQVTSIFMAAQEFTNSLRRHTAPNPLDLHPRRKQKTIFGTLRFQVPAASLFFPSEIE